MFPLFLQLPDKIVIDPNGPYISTSRTRIISVCISVISEFCQSSFVFSASTAYTSLCRGLKYILKISYFIQNHSNKGRIFDFLDSLFGQDENIALCLKKKSQKWKAFVLDNTNLHQTFTDYVSNQCTHQGNLIRYLPIFSENTT